MRRSLQLERDWVQALVMDQSSPLLKQIVGFAQLAPFGVQVYDANGYFVFVNEQSKQIFGAPPPSNYCVLKDERVAASGNLHLIHKAFAGEPSQLPQFWSAPRQKECAIETYMYPWLGEDGKVQFVLFLYKDVTGEIHLRQEREQVIKERDDAKSLIRAVLEQTQAVVYIKDLDGRYIYVNSQHLRIFNLEEKDVIGRTDFEIFPRHIAAEFHHNDQKVFKSATHIETEEIAIHSDQSAHTYISLKFPLKDSTGELYGLCGISTDVTERRRTERELNAAKRMEAVGILAGGIAHDFNNSLEIIMLVADTILMTGADQDPRLKTSIEAIKASVQGAAVLTRQLLAFARKQSFITKVLQPDLIVRETMGILRNALGADIHFDLDIDDSVWPLRMDPLQLEQILTNLCFNARDAMSRGGRLKVSMKNRSLPGGGEEWQLGKPTGEYVEILVADSGVGMDQATLERVFEPFFTTKPDGQGSGLGLSTVYGIVQQAGGDITVESEPGRGTTFKILFPRSESGTLNVGHSGEEDKRAMHGSETVLLVDDKPQLLAVTANLLKECGYKVIESLSPEAALTTYSALKGQIDIVVTDIVMPTLSGPEMVDRMAAFGKKPKVLFVSAYAQKTFASDLEPSGGHFLTKPYTANQLLREIRTVLDLPT